MSRFNPGRLARTSARHPWKFVALWVVILVVAGAATTRLGDALTTEMTFANNPESLEGYNLLSDKLNYEDPLQETIIIQSKTLTVDDPAFEDAVEAVMANLRATGDLIDQPRLASAYELQALPSPEMQALGLSLMSADRHSTLIQATFKGGIDAAEPRYEEFHTAIHPEGLDPSITVMTVGGLSINNEFSEIAESDLQKAEVIGIPIALIILVVVFAALTAAGIPIFLALISIAVAVGATAIIGSWREQSFFITNMITMIGLAVGIDYALFIVERYREERRRGYDKLTAIEISGNTASKAVLFSGMTVVLALLGMFLIPTSIFRSLGLGAILVVIAAVLAMLTLVPATLSLLGDRIDWPRKRRYDTEAVREQAIRDHEMIHRGFWGRIAKLVMEHPVISLVLGASLLIAAAIPYADLKTGTAGVETLPAGEVRTAYETLSANFGAGQLAPVDIVIEGERTPELEAAIANLVTTFGNDPRVASTAPLEWAPTNDVALIGITLATQPNSPASYEMVSDLREDILPAAFGGTGARALVTGETAFNKDFFEIVDTWTPIVFAFVLGLSFLLLMVVFRSIVVPIKAIIMNLLSVGAAYGLMVLVFQKGYLTGFFGFDRTPTIDAWIPIFLFCVLFGLSMDYHVFLLSRIREHYDQTHRNSESVAVGLQATARIITGAALIMVAVFVGFAAGRLVMFQQVGFGLAVAVLLDATIVRTILVPSSMALLGDRNWYLPSWLQWLPDLRIEGAPPVPVAVEQPAPALAD